MNGFTQIYRFTRHVWGVNSSPYIVLLAIKRLVFENVTNASPSILSAILQCHYMDDLFLSFDSLVELETIARESRLLFESREFTLRKWVSNNAAKSILSDVPPSDRTSNLKEIDLASQPMPDSKALGLKWKVEEDTLCICPDLKLTEVSTRRQMLSAIACQFDPFGIRGPWLLKGKLILQRVTAAGIDWDEKLPDEIVGECKSWITHLETLDRVSIPCCCFDEVGEAKVDKIACYELHGFCDASNVAIAGVVYLRRVIGNRSSVAFIIGKSKLVLTHQANWVISRKELEAAKLCAEIVMQVSKILKCLSCSFHFWTDSQVRSFEVDSEP